MAPISKENEVLTVATERSGLANSATDSRLEDTASRPQPVALEVPVTVNGARTVEGSDKREPFSETTKTVLVFGNGAVIRLGSPVSAGQLLFLTNEKTKKEVVCQVVKSKNYRNVSGYVELEFTESVVGFWGMRFPSDRIAPHAPAPSATAPPPAKSIGVAPITAAPKLVSPPVVAPKSPDVQPAQVQAEAKPALQAPTTEITPVKSVPSNPAPSSIPTTAAPLPPVGISPAIPAILAPSMPASLPSSVVSLLGAPEKQPALSASKPPAPNVPPENNKPAPRSLAAENSSEELRLQAARLQDQLSSLLFSAAPTAKPAPPMPDLDAKTVSGVATKVVEITKLDPPPVKAAPPTRPLPPPIKSSLDTEEVKIPSWLEPLARHAAAPASTPERGEREKSKHAAETAIHEQHTLEPLAAVEIDPAPEIQVPDFGSLLPLEEGATGREHSSGGSRKVLWIGAIAAAVLVAAGGAWYQFYTSNQVRSTPASIAPAASAVMNGAPPQRTEARPEEHAASRNTLAEREAPSDPNRSQRSGLPASNSKDASQSGSESRDNARSSAATIPAAITERISHPVAQPEPKKPELGEVHLASPTLSRPETQQADQVVAPTISTGNTSANADGIASGLAAGNGEQPAAPKVPVPIGGDVKSALLVSQVAPIYPALARNQHVSGDVVIDALIDANGRVTTMKVISGPTLLHQAAKDALRQWKYQPASLDGKPVPMHLTVTLQFRMQ
jgi:TonB family protein